MVAYESADPEGASTGDHFSAAGHFEKGDGWLTKKKSPRSANFVTKEGSLGGPDTSK
jgi:hypothetical protein